MINPKKKLFIVITGVSASGMTRKMAVYQHGTSQGREYMEALNREIAELCDLKLDKNGDLIIKGCGMDMAFWLAMRITNDLKLTEKQKSALAGNGGNTLDWQVL